MTLHGLACIESYNEAEAIFIEGLKRGEGSSAYALGNLYYKNDNMPNNIEKAILLYEKASELKNAKALSKMANFYYNGDSVEKNLEKSFTYSLLAVLNGDVESLVTLGDDYYDGIGTSVNLKKAFKCYEEALQEEQYIAAIRLAEMYYYGKYVKQSKALAYDYYKIGVKSGDAPSASLAFFCLGKMRFYGEGIEQDYATAVDFFRSSIVADDLGLAHLFLGKCYIHGYGVDVDLNEGYKELLLASERGEVDSDENLLDELVIDMDGIVSFKN